MPDWEVDIHLAKKLLVRTFPDIFRPEKDCLRLANGIEAFNISAYGYVVIVDRYRREVFRVGEPCIMRDVLEVLDGNEWISLVKPSADIFREVELDLLLKERDIPLVFKKDVSLFLPSDEPVDFEQLNDNVCSDSRYLLVWGFYIGEAFWVYFSSLVLRKCGVITGGYGLTHADLHGYFLRGYRPPIDYPYQWSLMMLLIKEFIVAVKPTFYTYGECSKVINDFCKKFRKMFGSVDTGIVVEAESTAYRANNHSGGSGIGQLKEKYLGYHYNIGFVSGPGLTEKSLVDDEASLMGVISCTEMGTPVMVLPCLKLRNGENLNLMSLKAKEFIYKYL